MGITISSLQRVNSSSDRHPCSAIHNGNTIDAVAVGSLNQIKALLHGNITCEYEIDEIISAECGLEKNDSVSGIFPLQSGEIAIDGSVHNLIHIDEQSFMIDIYIQNGADFLAITTDELGEKPPVGSRIRLTVQGLNVFPTYS